MTACRSWNALWRVVDLRFLELTQGNQNAFLRSKGTRCTAMTTPVGKRKTTSHLHATSSGQSCDLL
jgi:hypothetical protein